MKALHLDNGIFEKCHYEDAIYFNDDTCMLVHGDSEEGYTVTDTIHIDELLKGEEPGWTYLVESFEATDGGYTAITGETSWGGAGFIGIKKIITGSVEWIMHISTMNNPVALSFESGIIQAKTDLNFPYGVLYTVPAETPEKFSAQILTEEDSPLS